MFRLKKLTDYAILTMTCVARSPEQPWHAARDLATETHLPLPTVSKILKELSDHGLLVSHRGPKGGYTLARNPHEISVAEIVAAFEGPIGFTECSAEPGRCKLEPSCVVRTNSQVISQALKGTLERIRLSDLTHPLHLASSAVGRNTVAWISLAPEGVQ